MRRPRRRIYIFQDAVICGMIGGVIASLLGEPFIISAMLCAIAGPLVIFGATIFLDVIPFYLPGKDHGIYEFLFFSICVIISVAMFRLAG